MSCGVTTSDRTVPEKHDTATSSGTLRPLWRSLPRAPIAWASVKAKIASKSVPESISWSTAFAPSFRVMRPYIWSELSNGILYLARASR